MNRLFSTLLSMTVVTVLLLTILFNHNGVIETPRYRIDIGISSYFIEDYNISNDCIEFNNVKSCGNYTITKLN